MHSKTRMQEAYANDELVLTLPWPRISYRFDTNARVERAILSLQVIRHYATGPILSLHVDVFFRKYPSEIYIFVLKTRCTY